MAADLAALAGQLGLHDVTVIGHDWGAVFGYVYEAASPEQVSALGIVEDGAARCPHHGAGHGPPARRQLPVAHGLPARPGPARPADPGQGTPLPALVLRALRLRPVGHQRRRPGRVRRGHHPGGRPARRPGVYQDFFTSAEQVAARIKAQYDPENLFSVNANILPAAAPAEAPAP
jgi:pimeloyl-ACP methyl ester carboxylesterase